MITYDVTIVLEPLGAQVLDGDLERPIFLSVSIREVRSAPFSDGKRK